jgi:hypothetical protein
VAPYPVIEAVGGGLVVVVATVAGGVVAGEMVVVVAGAAVVDAVVRPVPLVPVLPTLADVLVGPRGLLTAAGAPDEQAAMTNPAETTAAIPTAGLKLFRLIATSLRLSRFSDGDAKIDLHSAARVDALEGGLIRPNRCRRSLLPRHLRVSARSAPDGLDLSEVSRGKAFSPGRTERNPPRGGTRTLNLAGRLSRLRHLGTTTKPLVREVHLRPPMAARDPQ